MATAPTQTTDPPKPREKSIAQVMSEDPNTKDCLFLVKNGVPFDVAFSLDPDMRTAFVVILGQLDGGTFNWTTMSWEKPR